MGSEMCIRDRSSIERNIVLNSAEEDLVMDNGQAEEKLLYKNALELFEASRYAEALEIFSEVLLPMQMGFIPQIPIFGLESFF